MWSQLCPSCGTQLPVDPRNITWCHSCGRNHGTSAPRDPTNALERMAVAG